jgi:predicted acylesterase/phospholipase RssA
VLLGYITGTHHSTDNRQNFRDLGLADIVTRVAGTSVGALNSTLFVNRDIKKAVQICDEVEQKDFTHADIPKLMGKAVATHMIFLLWGIIIKNPAQIPLLLGKSVKLYNYIYSIFVFISGRIFGQKKLEELIDKFNLIQKEN